MARLSSMTKTGRLGDSRRELEPPSRGALMLRVTSPQPPSRFDAFLCHNSEDKAAVMRIGRQLRKRGVVPWLDEWELRPGIPWQQMIEEELLRIPSAVVFIGNSGFGPWQRIEYEALLREFVRCGCPVVPAILPNCPRTPEMPVFLKGMMWVDFGKTRPNPLQQLIWGITGKRASG